MKLHGKISALLLTAILLMSAGVRPCWVEAGECCGIEFSQGVRESAEPEPVRFKNCYQQAAEEGAEDIYDKRVSGEKCMCTLKSSPEHPAEIVAGHLHNYDNGSCVAVAHSADEIPYGFFLLTQRCRRIPPGPLSSPDICVKGTRGPPLLG